MAHLGDITKVDGGKIPPVHVITFGSPCQNLSLIGNRSGLAGAKSSLFYQASVSYTHLDVYKRQPEYGGRAYLEKQDYILFKQKEQLAAQEQKLEELTMKIEDVEALVDEVADIAYDKAVEVVADTVKLETHKEDIKLVEQSKAWVLSPERKASKKEIEYATKRLDGVIARITNAMKSTIQKIQTTLMKPEVKKAGTEQIKKKAKSSIIEQLSRKKKEIAEREVSRIDQAKSIKQDMEPVSYTHLDVYKRQGAALSLSR